MVIPQGLVWVGLDEYFDYKIAVAVLAPDSLEEACRAKTSGD